MSGAAPVQPYRRAALFACAAACLAAFMVAVAGGAAQTGSVVIGTATVEPTDDPNADGKAEAFRTTASGTGTVSALQLYLSSSSSAAKVSAGIYSDVGGHPGTLLAKGSATAHAGDWNAVPLASPVTVAEGTIFWIAILSPAGAGTIVFRDQPGGGASETSLDSALTDLPNTWSNGTAWPDGPLSAFGVADVSLVAPDVLPPSDPLGVAITSTGQTSVSLSWSAATDDTGVSGYDVYRNGVSVGTTASTTFSVSGLACGTSYTFGVDAYDAAANHSTETTVAGATAPCSAPSPPATTDASAPSQPAGLILGSPAQTSVTLSWSASTDNVGVAGYGVYANGVSVGSTTSTSYTFSSLSCGTTYTVAVDAYDAAGNRSGKAGRTATTSACATAGLLLGDQTVGPNDEANSAGVAQAFRTTAAGSGRISELNVYVSGSSGARSIVSGLYADAGGTPGTLLAQGSATARAGGWMSVPLPSPVAVSAGATYWVAVLAPRGAGTLVIRDFVGSGASQTSVQSILTSLPGKWKAGKSQTDGRISAYALSADLVPPVQTDTLPPTSTLGLAVTSATQSSVALSWTPSTDNTGVVGYSVYRNGAVVGSTTSTTYGVPGLACGTSYTFAVDAYDAAGNRSAQTSITSSTAPCADATPPSLPGGLTTTVSQTSITLSWTASSDNVAVAGYGLYKNGSSVGSTSSTNYVFSGLTCGTTYTLGVDSYDAAGNRSAKASLGATTPACSNLSSASVFIAPSGSDSNPCTQAAPCQTMDRAYHVAKLGATVEMAGGSYPTQTVLFDSSKTGASDLPDVVFQPAAGASVTVNQLDIGTNRFTGGASHLTVQGITIAQDVSIPGCGQPADNQPCAADASVPGNDLSFLNLRVKGKYAFYCASCSNVLIRGGVWGPDSYNSPCGGSAHPEIQPAYTQTKRPNHITIESSTWQNFARCTTADHTECLQVEPGDYVTLRRNVFRNCDTIGVNFANDLANSNSQAGYRSPDHAVIENNYFAAATDATGGPTYYALNIRECTNCIVRYNSWLQAPRMPTGEISLNNLWEANVGPMGSQNCGITGVTYAYNVWTDAKCSSTDKQVSAIGFVNAASLDLRLTAGSPAIDAGNPSNYPASDIGGQARPLGGAPDAGADEAG
jgi:chitodextrinase